MFHPPTLPFSISTPLNRAHLFEAWSQINAGVLQKGQGSGLGLSLVKLLIALMGGTISVDTVEGKGAFFTLSIPSRATAKARNLKMKGDRPLEGVSILVVEEIEIVRKVITKMLSVQGGAVTAVPSVAEAVKVAAEQQKGIRFDLVLIDNDSATKEASVDSFLSLRETTIFGVGRGMKSEEIEGILFLKNFVQKFASEFMSRTGAVAIIPKPVKLETLLSAMKKHNIGSDGKACIISGSDVAATNVDTKSAITNLRILVVDDVDIVRSVMQRLLTHKGAIISTARDGADALQKVEDGATAGRPFDLVLMDKEMPGLDGYEACDKMPTGTSVFGMTGNAMTEVFFFWENQILFPISHSIFKGH